MRILLYRGKGPISAAIRYCSDGKYSHIAMLFDDMTLCEIRPFQRVNCRTLDPAELSSPDVDVFYVEASLEQEDVMREFLGRQIGKKYDYLAILGFVVHASVQGRKAYGRWICSELVFCAFRKAGIYLLERVDAWRVSPNMIGRSPLLLQ
jgi:uncharacterized protein YycO